MLGAVMHKPSPAEREIELAIQLVGEMPVDVRLTDAIDLLARSKTLVSEFVEDAKR